MLAARKTTAAIEQARFDADAVLLGRVEDRQIIRNSGRPLATDTARGRRLACA